MNQHPVYLSATASRKLYYMPEKSYDHLVAAHKDTYFPHVLLVISRQLNIGAPMNYRYLFPLTDKDAFEGMESIRYNHRSRALSCFNPVWDFLDGIIGAEDYPLRALNQYCECLGDETVNVYSAVGIVRVTSINVSEKHLDELTAEARLLRDKIAKD